MRLLAVLAVAIEIISGSAWAGESIGQWMPVNKSMFDYVNAGYKIVFFTKEVGKDASFIRRTYILQKDNSAVTCDEEDHGVGYLYSCSVLAQPPKQKGDKG